MTSDLPDSLVDPSVRLMERTWWHKPVIWSSFLLLLYTLREFFFIGFLTFLICFVVRSTVRFLIGRVSRNGNDRWLELALTLAVMLAMLMLLYGLGRYFVPQMIRQGKTLLAQIQDTSSEQVQNTLLANTIGTLRFEREFGEPDDPRYQQAQQEYQASDRYGEGLYGEFPKLHSRLMAEFEANYEQSQVHHLLSAHRNGDVAEESLKQWFLAVKAPELFHDKSAYYLSRWEAEYSSPEKAGELAKLKEQSDFESRRDAEIRDRLWNDVRSDPVLLTELKNQWTHALSIQSWDSFRNSPGYRAEFKKFYEGEYKEGRVPIDFEYFETLLAAYPKGMQAFMQTVRQHDQQGKVSAAHHRIDFESATKLELGRQWWATSHIADWVRDHAANDGPKAMEAMLQRFDKGFGDLVKTPIQIVTSLLLAFVILIEWHGLSAGIANLRNTRLQPIIDEVAPGMIAFGKLIGRSFQGQVIISILNACLMLIALWFIGVQYKFVLVLLVFLFSFIPVLGVLLSGIPICAIAILQPDGSIMMAFQVTVAIALIHFFEGMVVSPQIIGKIGNLHPVVVVVILLVAEHFFGMWGLLLGVPVSIYILRVVILRSPIPGIYEPVTEFDERGDMAQGVASQTS